MTVCIDSGKLATEACAHDARTNDSFSRLRTVKVYKEDAPTEYCTKHMTVTYCSSGGGVAGEYCSHFATIPEQPPESAFVKAIIEQRALLKMTQSEIDTINLAIPYNVWPEFCNNGYVYQVDGTGNGVAFLGFLTGFVEEEEGIFTGGTLPYPGNTLPYVPCQVHTQAAWEAYLASNSTVEPSVPEGGDNTGGGGEETIG